MLTINHIQEYILAFFTINFFFIILGVLPHVKNTQISFLSFLLNMSGWLITAVVCFSIFQCRGNTVYLGALPIYILVFYHFRKDNLSIRWLITMKELWMLVKVMIVANIIFLLQWLVLLDYETFSLKVVHGDYVFYAKVSQFLSTSHVETFVLSPYAKPTPYHYFELWLTSLANFFDINYYTMYMMVTCPVFYVLVLLLSGELIQDRSNSLKLVLGVLTLFATSFYVPQWFMTNRFLYESELFSKNLIIFNKVSCIYLYILVLILCYKYFQKKYFMILLPFLPLIYITQLFAYVGAVCGLTVFQYFKERKIDVRCLCFHIFIPVFISMFYKVNDYESPHLSSIDLLFVKTSINIYGGSFLRLILMSAPFLVLGYFYKSDIKFNAFSEASFLLLGSWVCALFGWALFQREVDAVQSYSNYIICIIGIGIAYLIVRTYVWIGFFLVIFIAVFNYKLYFKNSAANHNEISLLSETGWDFVFYKSKNKYSSPYTIHPYASNPFSEIFIYNDHIKMYDMAIHQIDAFETPYKNLVLLFQKSNEYKMFKNNNREGSDMSFVEVMGVKGLIFENKDDVPDEVLSSFRFYRKINEYEIWFKR